MCCRPVSMLREIGAAGPTTRAGAARARAAPADERGEEPRHRCGVPRPGRETPDRLALRRDRRELLRELVSIGEDLAVDACVQAREASRSGHWPRRAGGPSRRRGAGASRATAARSRRPRRQIATMSTCGAVVSRTMSGLIAAMEYVSTRSGPRARTARSRRRRSSRSRSRRGDCRSTRAWQGPMRLHHEQGESVEPVGTFRVVDPVAQAIEPARCIRPLADPAKSSLDGRVLRGLLRLRSRRPSAGTSERLFRHRRSLQEGRPARSSRAVDLRPGPPGRGDRPRTAALDRARLAR